LRAIDSVEDLESELGVPVVTSNSASLWAALRDLKVDARGVRAGRLFDLPPPAETSHVA
jgi:maleate isomerase